MYQEIKYEVSEPLGIITLNRPDRLNAWTNRMGDEVKHAVAEAEHDPQVVAIVITGEGRGFCAGADMEFLSDIGDGSAAAGGSGHPDLVADPGDPEMGDDFRGTYSYLTSVRKPIIGAINGPCAGMAVPIMLYCDLRFASDQARFYVAFPHRGLIAEWGIAWTLPRVVGTANALDLLLSGRKIDAEEAERMGLVNRIVRGDELMKHVREYVEAMASSCSPTSMRVIKQQVYQAWTESLGESSTKGIRLMFESFQRPDFKEGVQSFMQKRPPKFDRIS